MSSSSISDDGEAWQMALTNLRQNLRQVARDECAIENLPNIVQNYDVRQSSNKINRIANRVSKMFSPTLLNSLRSSMAMSSSEKQSQQEREHSFPQNSILQQKLKLKGNNNKPILLSKQNKDRRIIADRNIDISSFNNEPRKPVKQPSSARLKGLKQPNQKRASRKQTI